MPHQIQHVLADALRQAGCRLVKVDDYGDIRFTCALGQVYGLVPSDHWLLGVDPYDGEMVRWDLNRPDSLTDVLQWVLGIRNYWRSASRLVRRWQAEDKPNYRVARPRSGLRGQAEVVADGCHTAKPPI